MPVTTDSPGANHDPAATSPGLLGDNQPLRAEMVPTASLRALDGVRLFSRDDRRKVRRIVQRFGIQQPLVTNDSNEVVIGQALLIAAQELGISEVPVIRLKAIGELEAQALSIAYARLGDLGKPDQARIGEVMLRCEVEFGYDVSDFGYEVAEVDLMIDMAAEEPEDLPIPLEKQAVSALGDIWQMDDHRLICGDALDGRIYELLMEGEKAHAAFADTPYGCEIDGFVASKGRHREFVMGSGGYAG